MLYRLRKTFDKNSKLNNEGSVSQWLKIGNRTMIWLGLELGLAVKKKQFMVSPKHLKYKNVDDDVIPVYHVILTPQHQSIWEGTNT